mgnify:CR=1 FL=1
MALTNSQYDQLMRIYEQRQIDDEHRLRDHYQKAYSMIPALKELDQSISSLSVEKARRLLDGDSTALSSLKEDLHQLIQGKKSLLEDHGLSEDYLELLIPVQTVRIPAISAPKNVTALKRPSRIFYTYSQICRKSWTKRISLPFLLIIIPAII